MRTPQKISPYMLIQEFLKDDPWKLFVACIMLNQTRAKQVHGIINEFFVRWPDALAVLKTDESVIRDFIRPLGLYNRRARSLKKMSTWFLNWDGIDPTSLPGIGKYAADSFKIFCEGYLVEDVLDKELKNYVRWAKKEAGIYGAERGYSG